MTPNKKKQIKKIAFITTIALIFGLMTLRTLSKINETLATGLPEWVINFQTNSLIIVALLFIYACLALWLDDFFKKKQDRDYRPVLVIVVCGIICFMLFF